MKFAMMKKRVENDRREMGRTKDRVAKDRRENGEAKVEAREREMRICGGRKKGRVKNEIKIGVDEEEEGRNRRREGGKEVGDGR